jgi:hypothetical protein
LQKKPGMKRGTRGRPLKYGRPSRAVAITLPEDIIDALRDIHHDLGRAIVMLVSAFAPAAPHDERPLVDYEPFGRRRSLIVVDREAVKELPGCELIPLSEDRAFLALKEGSRLQDLELAILDRLADNGVTGQQRVGLEALRRTLMECRRARDIEVEPRSIFVVERSARTR